ncbi:hypothetical protein HXX76_007869 [Chlamydomonas incerta]|uniref:Uncharacterized protein n=1 Tax=Chlamydomonas incerta TaxID=51695 RepID=A0A835VYM7_CHLIN|nr:hypothetical protein HXX76_007869 [Chlamydomonas incerta]|eukprot:KAG2434142.1 hypothetical protein HXX76_007869 [Chlamydomonas incerta]
MSDFPQAPAVPGWRPDALSPPLPPGGPSSNPAGAGDTIQLSPVAVALAAAVLLINGAISLRFKLGLHQQLLVASVRMVVQLSILGYMLVPIFNYDRWWLVLLYGGFMLMIASLEAVQRPSYAFTGMLGHTVLAMAGSSGCLLAYLVLVVLALRPVWEAQYVIPLLGMLLGNATSAISVGLATVLEDLSANRAVVEHLLALGANRYEATDAAVKKALKVSMTPLLNQMSVMGVVSIPGMMTGQILAGGDPAQAARYQMVIMFVIGGATCLASVISVYLAVLHVVDATHTFRAERLIRKQKPAGAAAAAGGALAALAGMAAEAAAAARAGWATAQRKGAALGSCLAAACCCCLCPPVSASAAAARRRRVPVHGRRQRAKGGGGGSGGLESVGEGDEEDAGSWAGDTLPVSSGAQGGAASSSSPGSPFAPASGRRAWARLGGQPPGGAGTSGGGGGGGGGAGGGGWLARVSWASDTLGRIRGGAGAAFSGSGGGGGGHLSAAAAAHSLTPHDRLLSAESVLSGSADEGSVHGAARGGGGGGVLSPWSPRSEAAAGADEEAGGSARGGSVFGAQVHSGGGAGVGIGGGGGGDELAAPLLGDPVAGAGSGGSGSGGAGGGGGGGVVGTVVAVGAWLGSRASAGLGAAWDAYGRWRGGGGGGGPGGGAGGGTVGASRAGGTG